MPATALSPPLVPRRAVVTTLWSVLVLCLVPALASPAASVGAMVRGAATLTSGLPGGGKIDPALPLTGDTGVDVVISRLPQQVATVRGAIWDAGGRSPPTCP